MFFFQVLFTVQYSTVYEETITMTLFTTLETWKRYALLSGIHAGRSNTKISQSLCVHLRTDSYLYWCNPNIQCISWCLGWSLEVMTLCLYLSSHIASDLTRRSTSNTWRRFCYLGSRGWLSEDPTSNNRTLHKTTKEGECSVSRDKISATASPR